MSKQPPFPKALAATLILFSLVTAAGFVAFVPALSGAAEGQVAETWAETCASCHGAKLTGGQAKSLLDDHWDFGGDDASLAETIRSYSAELLGHQQVRHRRSGCPGSTPHGDLVRIFGQTER